MARNEEKANSVLNKWTTMKQEISAGVFGARRRGMASDCNSLREAEVVRRDLAREVMHKITEIQNASIGEFRIRDLNDEINRLLKIKAAWEFRIRELGGAAHFAGSSSLEEEGIELQNHAGYKYFGAAKNLPGVRELFEEETTYEAPKRARGEMLKCIDTSYFGYRDEEDEEMLKKEEEAENKAIAAAVNKWRLDELERKKQRMELMESSGSISATAATTEEESDEEEEAMNRAHIVVPSVEEVKKYLLESKKRKLLERYASQELQQSEHTAKSLLNVKQSARVE